MKKHLFTSLQTLLIFIAIVVIMFLAWFPLVEGKAVNLDLISIYADPFILYIYTSSLFFFAGLYFLFKLFEYAKKDRLHSKSAIVVLRKIKRLSIIMIILIGLAGCYILFFHQPEDDPAGFLGLCIGGIIISGVVALILHFAEKKFIKISS